MHELNLDRAEELYGPEWVEAAAWYREHSLDVVTDPDLVLQHLDHPAVAGKIEAEFTADTRRRARMFEALSYGDAGFLLTTPGPSLSGVLIAELGDDEQRLHFREYVERNRCRTFFAVTEPGRGSDAANLECRYQQGALTGEKMLFGNGAVAPIGTVLARACEGPLGTVALLLTPELVGSDAVSGQVLGMFAMHGAQLSRLSFRQLRVPESLMLGRHLKAAERGLMGMMKTFHRFRPGVASMAIGHAQAMTDYARRHFAQASGMLDRFDHMLAQARALNLAAAAEVDADPLRPGCVSLAKQRATAAAEQIATELAHRLPVTALVAHPWLAKSLADVFAFEFMEGITPVQLSNVYHAFLRHEVEV
ncbi:MAG: acyl-CoA dehydrogenase family protein [Streptosporangiaceae bacterium]